MKFYPIPSERQSSSVPQRFAPLSAADEYAALPWYQQLGQAADDTVRFLANGATLGYADKIAGYLGGEGTESERAKTARAKERAGSAGDVAEFVGSLAPASALGNSVLSATRAVPAGLQGLKGLAARSLAMGADGAAIGSTQAMGNDADPVTGALMGFAGGTLGNVAGERISAGASKVLGAFNKAPKTLTAEELKAAGTKAFKDAEQAGVIFKPEAAQGLRDAVYKDMAEFGYDPALHPGAAVVFDRLDKLANGGNVGLEAINGVRKIAGRAYTPSNPENNKLLGEITNGLDEFVANVRPDDVLTGDPAAASQALGTARDYWSRFRKLDKVNDLLDRAGLNAGSTGSGGNVENATRQQLKRILTDKKMMRGFTVDEKAAVKTAVLGSPAQNALRLAGKLSPQGNGLMLAIQGGLTATNPYIGVPVMLAGYVAKKSAEAMTARNADLVKKLIAAGGSKSALAAPKNALQRLAESKRDAITRALFAGGLVAAGQ